MKTQCVSSVNFQGGLSIVKSVAPEVRTAIEKSPAMKRFGMLYNAEVSQARVASRRDKKVSYSSLIVDNVRPRNVFVAFFDFVTGRSKKRFNGIYYNPRQQTDAGLIGALCDMKKNSFLKLIVGEK